MKKLKSLSTTTKALLGFGALVVIVGIASNHTPTQPTPLSSSPSSSTTSTTAAPETTNETTPALQSAPVPTNTTSTTSTASPAKVAPKPDCDPNYSGACVPNVYPSDVDCAGGSGNGPYYVSGPVHVIGSDIYGLDRDGDGLACE